MDGWVTVDRRQLLDCTLFFQNDPNVQTAHSFRLGALLNGGIVIKRKGKTMTGAAKDFTTKEFTRFLNEVVCNWWTCGFAACVWEEHPKFGGVPRCLDLTQVITRYNKNIFGHPTARYFYEPREGYKAEVEIENVLTQWFTPPDSSGNVRSLMMLLAQDALTEQIMQHFYLVAMKGRALPVLITELERPVYDRDAISAPTARTPEQIRAGTLSGEDDTQENPDKSNQVIANTEQFYDRTNPAMTDTFLSSIAAVQRMPHYAATYQLAQGRKQTTAQMPEAPADLLAFRIARQERAFSLMGVPLAMVTNATSAGGSKMSQGENSNSFILFENSQSTLKQQLIAVATQMFYSINLLAHLQEYVAHTKPEDYNAEDMAASAEVTIVLPSMPEESKLIEYYQAGWLKYESLIESLATKHCIPLESFNTKPELSVAEQMGEFPAEPKPPAKKAKK